MASNSIFDKLKKAEQGARISIITYFILTSFKLVCGIIFNSSALVADGINNATDVISSVFVLIGLKISRKPADSDHKYGHFRAELIASLVASFIMLYAGIEVVTYAIKKILSNSYETPSFLSAIVAIISFFIMISVFFYNNNLAKKLGSKSLKAAALDNMSDALVSLGTFIGIVGTFLGFKITDAIAAIVVGIIIIITAINIFKESTHILTDGIDEEIIDNIFLIVKEIPNVRTIKDIKGRSHGLMNFIDITITVDSTLSVEKSHDITVLIEKALKEEFYYCETLVHIEPNK